MRKFLILSVILVIMIMTVLSFGSQSVFKESVHHTKNLADEEFTSVKIDDETYSFDFAVQELENSRICYLLYYPFGAESLLESYWGSLIISLSFENDNWIIENIVFEDINSYPFERFSLGKQHEVVDMEDNYIRNVQIQKVNNELYQYVVEEIVYDEWLGMTAGSCKISLYLGVDGDNINFYMNKDYRKGNYFQ